MTDFYFKGTLQIPNVSFFSWEAGLSSGVLHGSKGSHDLLAVVMMLFILILGLWIMKYSHVEMSLKGFPKWVENLEANDYI